MCVTEVHRAIEAEYRTPDDIRRLFDRYRCPSIEPAAPDEAEQEEPQPEEREPILALASR